MDPWRRHLGHLLAGLCGLVAIAIGLVWVANPFGNLPGSPLPHVLMDDNQRFQYPAVIRSGRYDSLVVGTSTGRLLEPRRLEAIFGGRFANLALNSGTAWEQMRLVRLFSEVVAPRGTLVVALDHVWCAANANTERITRRGFPEWMFDHDAWNDVPNMLNVRTIEIAGRRIGHALGLVRERWPHNGYEVFVPPESAYDLARARQHIWGPSGRPGAASTATATEATEATPGVGATFDFPALSWLDEMIDARHGWRRVVMLITPVHRSELPDPNTAPGVREAACKVRMTAIAAKHGVALVDFRILSPITRSDENYWDRLHYRVPIAGRIVDDLAAAVANGSDDPGGDYRVLNKASPASAAAGAR